MFPECQINPESMVLLHCLADSLIDFSHVRSILHRLTYCNDAPNETRDGPCRDKWSTDRRFFYFLLL